MIPTDPDPETGLRQRSEFLAEVRRARDGSGSQVRQGCLLILHFPVLRQIQESAGRDSAVSALRNLLGIVETRLRSRDMLGRIRDYSLCIFLRRCREQDAMLIAEQYTGLLRDIMFDAGSRQLPMDLHYRIVPLDWRGQRRRQGVSGSVRAKADSTRVLSVLRAPSGHASSSSPDRLLDEVAGSTGEPGSTSGQQASATLVHLAPRRNAGPQATVDSNAVSGTEDSTESPARLAGGYRLRPGMVLQHRPLVCCYRVRSLAGSPAEIPSAESALFRQILDVLALDDGRPQARLESQIIVPVDAGELRAESANWLKGACRERRVAPADLCLSVNLEAVSRNLRLSLPAIRSFNRQGIMMMLEGLNSAVQFSTIRPLAGFEYLLVSSRMLQESMRVARVRKELETLIRLAGEQQRQVCADGIDTPALLAHAQGMGIEIGFGRQCGRSEPFPGRL